VCLGWELCSVVPGQRYVVKDKRPTEIKHEMSIDNKRVDENKMRGQTGKYR
jgi:hypothetical protein